MLLEPFPTEVAQEIPPSYFGPPSPLEFEIRIVIWETNKIPLPPGSKTVSIMVKCSLDASATGGSEEINKETDVHNGNCK
jgi:hypothetical protein